MVPQQFTVSIERGENALCSLHEDIARFRINRSARGGIAIINSVAQKIVVQTLPKFLAGLSVETGDALLEIRALAKIAHDVKPAVGNHRRGLARKIGNPESSFLVGDLVG